MLVIWEQNNLWLKGVLLISANWRKKFICAASWCFISLFYFIFYFFIWVLCKPAYKAKLGSQHSECLWLLVLVTCDVEQVTGDRWQVTGDRWHATHETWNITHDTWSFFPQSFNRFGVAGAVLQTHLLLIHSFIISKSLIHHYFQIIRARDLNFYEKV